MGGRSAFRCCATAMIVVLSAGVAGWAQTEDRTERARGYLGVTVESGEEGDGGIVVQDVTPGGPAAKAGLKKGDRIVKMEGKEINNIDKLLSAIADTRPGDRLKLGIRRDGKDESVTVTVGERRQREAPDFPPAPGFRRPAFLGVETRSLTAELKERLKVELDDGLVVTEVVPRSPAARAGLQRDDVITAVDDRAVKAPADLVRAIQKAGAGKEVTLKVVRGKEKLSVKATLRGGPFGFPGMPGQEGFPMPDMQSMFDQGRRVRELERRVDELEKRLRQLEKK